MKRRRNRNRKRIEITPRYFLLGLTGFCVVLMLVSLFAGGIFAPVRNFTNIFVQPMQKGVNTIGRWVQSKTEAFQNYDALLKENETLKDQLEQSQKQVAQYQQNSYELERLQALYESLISSITIIRRLLPEPYQRIPADGFRCSMSTREQMMVLSRAAMSCMATACVE